MGAGHAPRDDSVNASSGCLTIVDTHRTDPEQAARAKPPYDDVRLKGQVEGRFLYRAALSKHLLPFAVVNPALVVLPVENLGDKFVVREAAELRRRGYREVADWMQQAETIWKKKRGEKAEKQTVYQRLDYQRELTHQNPKARHLVLYNAAGSNMAAAHLDRSTLTLPFVVEHKLYWRACETQVEADYLVAILNARCVNDRIKPFQTLGLLGERDIEKKVLDLAIPKYDPKVEEHRTLAALGASARNEAASFLAANEMPPSIALRRREARKHLKPLLKQIDAIVKTLI